MLQTSDSYNKNILTGVQILIIAPPSPIAHLTIPVACRFACRCVVRRRHGRHRVGREVRPVIAGALFLLSFLLLIIFEAIFSFSPGIILRKDLWIADGYSLVQHANVSLSLGTGMHATVWFTVAHVWRCCEIMSRCAFNIVIILLYTALRNTRLCALVSESDHKFSIKTTS